MSGRCRSMGSEQMGSGTGLNRPLINLDGRGPVPDPNAWA